VAHPTTTTADPAASGTHDTALSVRGVYKIFGPKPGEALKQLKAGKTREDVSRLGTAAVIDASFDVAPGEIFVVMGLSGSGKSTLIRTLNGLWNVTAGSVEIGGVDLAKASKHKLREVRAQKISMVFQHFALLPHRTNLENTAYPLEIQGVSKEERRKKAREALHLVGLGDWIDHYPSELSGGMQQRVGLARALAADTDILLMDEAFSALDPLIRREMQDQLISLQRQLGKTIVFITHDLDEAMRLGDRIAIMRNGEIVQIGTGEEILSHPATDYVSQFVADVDKTKVVTAGAVARRATAEVFSNHGPARARQAMVEAQLSAAYVVDTSRRLLGYIVDEEVIEAQRQGAKTVEGIIHTEAFAVTDDTVLSDVLAPAAESRLPVAVVDSGGHLVGVIPRTVLLSAMVPSEAPKTGPIPLPTGAIPVVSQGDSAADPAKVAGSAQHRAESPADGEPTDAETTTQTEGEQK
jgi:glycine betaine/proline transport system ATP-binding protein